MTEIKITLDDEDIRCLVRGGELTIYDDLHTVKLILADIGFSVIGIALADAGAGLDQYVPHKRDNK